MNAAFSEQFFHYNLKQYLQNAVKCLLQAIAQEMASQVPVNQNTCENATHYFEI